MEFVSPWMLLGLLAIFVPVIIHILNRKSGKVIKWGAFIFLLDSMQQRRKRVLLEEVLLLATRCLLIALIALAMARPFIQPGSRVPWAIVLPMLLFSVVAFGVSFAVWRYPKWRRRLFIGAIVMASLAIGAVAFERYLNLSRFGRGAQRDIVIIIDGSSSMTMTQGGPKSNFETAIEEAESYIQAASRTTAFGIVVGGPVPQVLTPAPITDRRELYSVLGSAQPTHGTMRMMPTLAAAAVTLSSGANPGKQIILVGDGQTAGWNLDIPERWKVIETIFGQLPTKPHIIWRTLPLPASVRNVAMKDISVSRDIVGTDREVEIRVTVANTGTEAVTPQEIRLFAEGKTFTSRNVGQLESGTSQTVAFKHKFSAPGSQVITASVVAGDDMPPDDSITRVVNVTDTLKVLIVDGNPVAKLFDRPSSYMSIALRPEVAEAAAAGTGTETQAEKHGFLVMPEVVDAPELLKRKSLADCSVIILADVPRLPDETSRLLSRFVANGGGLLISPGSRIKREFYNSWEQDGESVLPLPFVMYASSPEDESLKPFIDPSTFSQDSLKTLKTGTDLGKVMPQRWWCMSDSLDQSRVVARLTNKDPFIAIKKLGLGMVAVSAIPFDASVSEIPSRGGFVPLLHELVYHLSNPTRIDLNLLPVEGAMIPLAGVNRTQGETMGLNALYYPRRDFSGEPIRRVDPQIAFDWVEDSPFPANTNYPKINFSVRWSGSITPRFSGEYSIWMKVDDHATLSIDDVGKADYKFSFNEPDGTIPPTAIKATLEGGRAYNIRISYRQDGGAAKAHLFWVGDRQPYGIIPSSVLLPSRSISDYEDFQGVPVEVRMPSSSLFHATIVQTAEGSMLRISRSLVPGLYFVTVPEDMKESLKSVLDPEGKIPFYVNGGVEESRLEAVSDDQLSFLRNYVNILRTTKPEDVVKTLDGESFGQEIWRVLAYFALALFALEILLTRWIATQRRTGEKEEVVFEENESAQAKSFKEQLEAVKKG